MAHLIDKDALVAEIESYKNSFCDRNGYLEDRETNGLAYDTLCELEDSIDTLEAEDIELSNPRFPHLNNIVDKVFGTGNLESLEYEEAEQLVLLAKEELLKDLKVKEVDLEEELEDFLEKNSDSNGFFNPLDVAKHFFELGKAQKGE